MGETANGRKGEEFGFVPSKKMYIERDNDDVFEAAVRF